MFYYESPIKQFVSEMQTTYENDAIKVIQNFGFDIDKNELAKALAYDRKQYEIGYQQGKADGAREFAEYMKNVAHIDVSEYLYEYEKEQK